MTGTPDVRNNAVLPAATETAEANGQSSQPIVAAAPQVEYTHGPRHTWIGLTFGLQLLAVVSFAALLYRLISQKLDSYMIPPLVGCVALFMAVCSTLGLLFTQPGILKIRREAAEPEVDGNSYTHVVMNENGRPIVIDAETAQQTQSGTAKTTPQIQGSVIETAPDNSNQTTNTRINYKNETIPKVYAGTSDDSGKKAAGTQIQNEAAPEGDQEAKLALEDNQERTGQIESGDLPGSALRGTTADKADSAKIPQTSL